MKRWLLLLPLLLCALPARATTTLSRVGSCNGTTSCTPPAHQVGDLFVGFAFRGNSSTAPAIPSGWTTISAATGSGTSFRVACKVALSNAEGATGFTNATGFILLVYRGSQQNTTFSCDSLIVGGKVGTDSAGSATLSYPGITLTNTNGTSWVVGCGGHSTATNVNQAPTGMTLVTAVTGNAFACSDTNAPVSAWTTQTVGVNANAAWSTYDLEIRTCQTSACAMNVAVGNVTGSTTTTMTNAANHSAGTKLALGVISATGGRTVSMVANTAGDTWAQCSGSLESSSTHMEVWETIGATNANSSDVVTVTMNSADTFTAIGVVEISGVGSGACETGQIANCASCTTITSPSFSPAHSGNFNYVVVNFTGPTPAAGTNYSLLTTNPTVCNSEYRADAPSGAQTASFTSASNTMWISLASFKAAGAAGSGGQVGAFLVGP